MDEPVIPDERLELLFCCCHPALALDAQVALTLRAVGGLSTDEIAAAFLVAPEAMKRRLSRTKTKIKAAGVPFSIPADHLLPERLAAVLAVIYLIFNEGYGGRADLADDGLRLGWMLAELMPDEPEVHGLLALMLLHDSRRDARFAGDELVLLADQDRSLWDVARIEEGRRRLDRAIALRAPGRPARHPASLETGPPWSHPAGPYVLQAAIASLQLEETIDWPQVAALYRQLVAVTRSPVVELNYAVALAEVGEIERALELVDRLEPALSEYLYLHSTRGELLRRMDRPQDSRTAYQRALALARREPERRFLEQRLAEL